MMKQINDVFKKVIEKNMYEYQHHIIAEIEKNNFLIINKSRQTGISTLLACYGLIQSMLYAKTVLIISPSERQSKHVMDYVRFFINKLKEKFVIETEIEEEQKRSIIFKNKGIIASLPNSANTVRGFKADLIVLDEFAHFLNQTDEEMWQAITPSISRGGKVCVISTPFGENGLFYKFWNDPTFKKVTINHTECLDLNIEEIRKTIDEITFQQEYNNKFIGEVNSYFPYELIQPCINPELETKETPEGNQNYYLGVDFGRKKDLTVITGIEKQKDKYVLKIFKSFRNTPFEEQLSYLKTVLQHINIVECRVDSTGLGLPLTEELQKKYSTKIRPHSFTNELKEKLMVNLRLMFEQRKIEIPNNSMLINSLHAIQRKKTAGLHISFDSERSDDVGHSDAAWSLALAVHQIDKKVEWAIG